MKWFLLKNLIENELLDKYDFFIITRSDFLYTLPHPSIDLFSKDRLYIPEGEFYGGVTDRHVVLPRKFVKPYLNILNTMISNGRIYYRKMAARQPLNLERLIKFHLTDNEIFPFVNFFPYVMYSVRAKNGSTRWSEGVYSEELGYCIKYPTEYTAAGKHKADFQKEGGSIDTFYQKRIRILPRDFPF